MPKFAFVECLSLVSSYVGGSVFFSHPTRSLFLSFSLPLFQVLETQVCLTQVCLLDKCPSTPTLSVLYTSSHDKYLYTSVPPSFTLVYSQTHSLEARLWESEINAISPLSKKRALLCLQFLRAFLSLSTQVHMAANVGPKSTIRIHSCGKGSPNRST